MTNPAGIVPVADLSTYRTRLMTRCALQGHTWTATATGQACTRCTMTITAKEPRCTP